MQINILIFDVTNFRYMLHFDFSQFPALHTNRLILRQVSADDVNEIISLRSNKEVMKYIDRPLIESTEAALQLIQKILDGVNKNEAITWAIALQDDARLIGTIGFWKIDAEHHRAEIGYLLHPDHQQKGIMQEAISAVLNYGFSTMQLHTIEANVNPANEASKKLLKKNKFKQEAYFRENFYYNGVFMDTAIFSLLTPFK
jgi:ribosomal-protein-alanine N-acetyltransferase